MAVGWKTTRLDLAAERIVFIRDASRPRQPMGTQPPEPPPLRGSAASVGHGDASGRTVLVDPSALSGAAMRLIEDIVEEQGCDVGTAIAALINRVALERRRQLIDRIRANAPVVPGDSTDLIREDRDSR
jgi:hypothetical protein